MVAALVHSLSSSIEPERFIWCPKFRNSAKVTQSIICTNEPLIELPTFQLWQSYLTYSSSHHCTHICTNLNIMYNLFSNRKIDGQERSVYKFLTTQLWYTHHLEAMCLCCHTGSHGPHNILFPPLIIRHFCPKHLCPTLRRYRDFKVDWKIKKRSCRFFVKQCICITLESCNSSQKGYCSSKLPKPLSFKAMWRFYI